MLVRAGKGRMFKCLQESLAQPDFGQACRALVEERGQRMQEDYRLDYGVAEACESDVTTFCASEKVCIVPFLLAQAQLNESTISSHQASCGRAHALQSEKPVAGSFAELDW